MKAFYSIEESPKEHAAEAANRTIIDEDDEAELSQLGELPENLKFVWSLSSLLVVRKSFLISVILLLKYWRTAHKEDVSHLTSCYSLLLIILVLRLVLFENKKTTNMKCKK